MGDIYHRCKAKRSGGLLPIDKQGKYRCVVISEEIQWTADNRKQQQSDIVTTIIVVIVISFF